MGSSFVCILLRKEIKKDKTWNSILSYKGHGNDSLLLEPLEKNTLYNPIFIVFVFNSNKNERFCYIFYLKI